MGANPHDPESAAALAIARGDISKVSKQDLIEQAVFFGQMAGRIETTNMFALYGNVATLVLLKQVKDTKNYKLFGTWAEYCKNIGLDRRKVDEDILNLGVFGEEFLASVANLGLGYRNLSKLRQLEHDGGIKVEDGVVYIGGEEIPLGEDHNEDLQNAIARIVDDAEGEARTQTRISKSKDSHIKKLINKLDKHERKAEQMDIPEDELAYSEYMAKIRTGFDGWALACSFQSMEEAAEDMTPGKRAELLSTIKYIRDHGELLYQQAIDHYGQGLTMKGETWHPKK